MSNTIQFQQDGPIGTLTLNRPKINSLNTEMITEFRAKIKEISDLPGLQVVILTGEGIAFCGGADIEEMKGHDETSITGFAGNGQSLCEELEEMPQVTIAAINGFALGGGMEVALACDLRIASEKAKLGLPEVTLGLIPGFGGTQRMARLIGTGRAKELIFTGGMIKPDRALELGILNGVCAPEELMDQARELAGQITKNGPRAVRMAKETINTGVDLPLKDGLARESRYFVGLFKSPEPYEGLAAFLEKRPPNFADPEGKE